MSARRHRSSALVTLQRLGELVLAAPQHAQRCCARGAIEIGARPLSADRRAACRLADRAVGLRPRSGRSTLPGLALFAVLQGLRVWVLATLGPRWTTRIIVLPGAPLVASGPYRYLSHPNYAVVVGEIAVLPLACICPGWSLRLLGAQCRRARRSASAPRRARSPRCARSASRAMSGRPAIAADRRAAATWAGFAADVPRHVHGHPRYPGRRDLAADDPGCARISPDAMSWVQTAYLIAEVIAIPLTGLFTRVADLALAVRRRPSACSRWRRSAAPSAASFARCWSLPRAAGLCRRRADPGGVLRGVPAVSAAAARASRPRSAASSRCWRRPSDRSSAAGSPRPIPGTGCS